MAFSETIGTAFLSLTLIVCTSIVGGVNIYPPDHVHNQTGKAPHFLQTSCGVLPKVKIRPGIGDPGSGTTAFGQIPWHLYHPFNLRSSIALFEWTGLPEVGIFHKPESALICSGVLLSSNVVLTSAICLLAVESSSDLEIRFGDWDISDKDSASETYQHFTSLVTDVILYPDIPVGTDHPTIALLKVADQVNFKVYPQIGPICIPPTRLSLEGELPTNCWVSGWGSQSQETNSDSFFQTPDDEMKTRAEFANYPVTTSLNRTVTTIRPIHKLPVAAQPNLTVPTPILDMKDRHSGENNDRNSLEKLIKFHGDRDPSHSNFMSQDVHRSESGIMRVPDPVQDYFDEAPEAQDIPNRFDTPAAELHGAQDAGILAPLDSEGSSYAEMRIPILEHPEGNVHKHKLKYKKGKMLHSVGRKEEGSRGRRREVKGHSHKKKRWLTGNRRMRTLETDAVNDAWLNLFQIQIHRKCPVRSNSVDASSGLDLRLSKTSPSQFCITPQRGPRTTFPCMVDMGSPVFCTIKGSVETDPDNLAHPEKAEVTYLFGVVSSFTPKCNEILKPNHIESQEQYKKIEPIELPLSEHLRTFIFNT